MALALVLNRRRQVPAEDTAGFGAIAERFRRAGELERAVSLCQEGLAKYPRHLSSRVTLGWALLDLGRYDEARVELEQVLKRAPDNLAAIRGLAQLHDRTEHDDVASMQTGETMWTPPDVDLDSPEIEAESFDGEIEERGGVSLDTGALDPSAGPWVGLQQEAAVAPDDEALADLSQPISVSEADEPSISESFFAETPRVAAARQISEADALAAQLLAGGPRPVERMVFADDTKWSPAVQAPQAVVVESPAASVMRHVEPLVESDDHVWRDDGPTLEVAEPAQPRHAALEIVQPRLAVPDDEIILDEGPGPWPPVFLDDDAPAPTREPIRLAHVSAERDAWPPVELRPAVKAAASVVPATTEGTEFLTTVTKESRPGLLSALTRFRRRVDARRRESVSEYVAG